MFADEEVVEREEVVDQKKVVVQEEVDEEEDVFEMRQKKKVSFNAKECEELSFSEDIGEKLKEIISQHQYSTSYQRRRYDYTKLPWIGNMCKNYVYHGYCNYRDCYNTHPNQEDHIKLLLKNRYLMEKAISDQKEEIKRLKDKLWYYENKSSSYSDWSDEKKYQNDWYK